MNLLTSDIVDTAKNSVLCWLATVDSNGQPNVSPKEIYAIFDEQHLVVANIASPTTVRNIKTTNKVCLTFVDVFIQKGFKIFGTALNLDREHSDYAKWADPLFKMAGPRFPIQSVIVVRATAIESVIAPSYKLHPTETNVQAQIESALKTYGVLAGDRFR